jgi:hypothetical protein
MAAEAVEAAGLQQRLAAAAGRVDAVRRRVASLQASEPPTAAQAFAPAHRPHPPPFPPPALPALSGGSSAGAGQAPGSGLALEAASRRGPLAVETRADPAELPSAHGPAAPHPHQPGGYHHPLHASYNPGAAATPVRGAHGSAAASGSDSVSPPHAAALDPRGGSPGAAWPSPSRSAASAASTAAAVSRGPGEGGVPWVPPGVASPRPRSPGATRHASPAGSGAGTPLRGATHANASAAAAVAATGEGTGLSTPTRHGGFGGGSSLGGGSADGGAGAPGYRSAYLTQSLAYLPMAAAVPGPGAGRGGRGGRSTALSQHSSPAPSQTGTGTGVGPASAGGVAELGAYRVLQASPAGLWAEAAEMGAGGSGVGSPRRNPAFLS